MILMPLRKRRRRRKGGVRSFLNGGTPSFRAHFPAREGYLSHLHPTTSKETTLSDTCGTPLKLRGTGTRWGSTSAWEITDSRNFLMSKNGMDRWEMPSRLAWKV